MDQQQPEQIAPTSTPADEEKPQEGDASADLPPIQADLPPIQNEPISAVLPMYNDLPGLQSSLETWVSVLNNLNREYEILLIDDASTDGSFELAHILVEKNPRVRLLRHESHKGFGACLRSGLEAARFPLLLISTCDSRYQPSDFTRFLQLIDRVHLVAGYRTLVGHGSPGSIQKYKRNWTERLFRLIIRIIFGLRLKDPECWFLLARRSIFERIPIQSNGSFAFAEILAKANFLGCLMSEVPASYQAIPGAVAKWSNSTLREKLTGFRRVFSHPDFGRANAPGK
jgi:glycosyltransferase involved in cell wall biosynthesis